MKKDFGLQLAWDQAPHWGKKAKNGVKQEKYRRTEQGERSFFFFFSPTPILSPFPHNAEPGDRLDYSQTKKTVNTRNISRMLLCCEKKKEKIRPEKQGQARTLITVCGFVASSRVIKQYTFLKYFKCSRFSRSLCKSDHRKGLCHMHKVNICSAQPLPPWKPACSSLSLP